MAFLASLEHDLRPFFLQLRFSVGRKMTFPQCDSPSGKCPNYRIFLKLRRRSRPDGRRRWWRRSRPNECGRRVDQAATISLRGPKEDLHSERASASLMGWVGWTEYQKCPSIFFILCKYIGKVYIYL